MFTTIMTFIGRMLNNRFVQYGLVILGAFIGYQAWKYHQQSIGQQKLIAKLKDAANKSIDNARRAEQDVNTGSKRDKEIQDKYNRDLGAN